MPTSYLWLIPLLPFAGFLVNGTIGRRLPRTFVTAVALVCTAIPAAIVAWLWVAMKAAGAPDSISVISRPFGYDWIAISGFHADFAFTVGAGLGFTQNPARSGRTNLFLPNS